MPAYGYNIGILEFKVKFNQGGLDGKVTPPRLIPIEYGNKVKTDKRDRRKLASFLAKGLLKGVFTTNSSRQISPSADSTPTAINQRSNKNTKQETDLDSSRFASRCD